MSQRRHFLGLSAVIAFAQLSGACSDATKEPADEPGTIRGVLRSATADYFDENRHERLYALQLKDGSYVELRFAGGPPKVDPGSEIVVYGQRFEDGVHVDRVRVIENNEGLGQSGARLIDPTPLTPPLKGALVSVDPTYTLDKLQARVLREDFIRQVMEVSSYGRWTMQWDVFGPYTIPNDCGGTFYSNVGTNGVAAMKAAGVDADAYQQIQFLLPSNFSSCGWGGFGLDGHTPFRTDGLRGEYNPWSYVKGSDREGVMVQEIGHNWGLAHVHFCPNTQTPTPNCSGYVEYGSPFTPMANGNNVYLNAWERIQMNFLGGCNMITVTNSGTYDIGSLSSACNGPQVLRIAADRVADAAPANAQRYYYIEYRTPVGIDVTNGVMVHYSTDVKEGGWSRCDWGGPDCPEDWIISPLGTTAASGLMKAGAEWTTPQGVTIKIVSLGDTAKFEMTFATPGTGGTTCLDGTPWDNIAPVCKAGPPPIDGGAGGSGGTSVDAGRPDATGGAGGAGGSAGAGGSGTGGAAGATGGSAGKAGAGGGGAGGATGGAGGTSGGASGSGGAAGGASGGAAGGSSGASGSGAAGGSGSGGGAGTSVGTGGSVPPSDDSGCGCRIPSSSTTHTTSALGAAFGLGMMARLRRRSRRNRS